MTGVLAQLLGPPRLRVALLCLLFAGLAHGAEGPVLDVVPSSSPVAACSCTVSSWSGILQTAIKLWEKLNVSRSRRTRVPLQTTSPRTTEWRM